MTVLKTTEWPRSYGLKPKSDVRLLISMPKQMLLDFQKAATESRVSLAEWMRLAGMERLDKDQGSVEP